MRELPTLCADPAQYETRLAALRRPMQAAINRYVRSAFFVKQACTSISNELAPMDRETAVCNEPILRHEPYNLAEGSFVVNLTLHLLAAGSSHCAIQDAALYARWAAELEARLAEHKRNMAFERLWARFSGRLRDAADPQTGCHPPHTA